MKRVLINPLIFLFLVSLLTSCAKSKIQGLWQVDRVLAESSEVTPKGRWVRFEKDGRQESGNGWQKHSYGTWDYNKKKITIIDENGPLDEFGHFTVSFEKKQMIWERREDGRRIRVYLSKIEKIPTSHRDKIIGVWDMERALKDGQDATDQFDPFNNRFIFVRWDNTYIDRQGQGSTKSGFYSVHAHREEMEIFYNDAQNTREVWKFEVKADKLYLTSRSNNPEIILEFKRTDQFLK